MIRLNNIAKYFTIHTAAGDDVAIVYKFKFGSLQGTYKIHMVGDFICGDGL